MAKANASSRWEPKYFLKVAAISVFGAVILSRLSYLLYSATYYDTSVSDTLFNLIYHLANTVFAASRGVILAMLVASFFLDRQKLFRPTVLICGGGILLFDLSAFFADLVSGYLGDTWLGTLLYTLFQVLIDLGLELAIPALILYFAFRRKVGYEPVTRIFSKKNPPLTAALTVTLVYFVQCLFVPTSDVIAYLRENPFDGALLLEIVARLCETAMNGFVIPYAVCLLVIGLFAPKNIKN